MKAHKIQPPIPLTVFVLVVAISLIVLVSRYLNCPTSTSIPEGRIAFISNRDGNDELYVINADGTGLTRLTHTEIGEWKPVWSPDGVRLAFIRYTSHVPFVLHYPQSIHVLDTVSSIEEMANDCVTGLYCGLFELTDFRWSNAGQCLIWAYIVGHYQLYYGETSSSSIKSSHLPCLERSESSINFGPWRQFEQRFVPNNFISLSQEMRSMALSKGLAFGIDPDEVGTRSPDKRWIAFSAKGPDGNANIFILDTNTNELRRLTTTPASDVQPNWSPVP